jgi:uncharacterized protein (DUF2384 family)
MFLHIMNEKLTPARQDLTPDEGAKAIRAARICAIAETVFGNNEKAQCWLSKPKKA